MSKQRKGNPRFAGSDPTLDHASALVGEYTRKLRTMIRRIHDIRAKYLAKARQQRKQAAQSSVAPLAHSPQDQQIWIEVVNDFQTRHQEYADYLRTLMPQAIKLAQHVSQLITHGTDESIIQIELSLRVAELESAIQTANKLFKSQLLFLGLD